MAKSLADLSAERGFIDKATAQEHNKADEQAASEEMPIKENAQEVQDNTESKTESEQAASGDAEKSNEEVSAFDEIIDDAFWEVAFAIWQRIFCVDKSNTKDTKRLWAFIEEHEKDIRVAIAGLVELLPFLQAEIDELNEKSPGEHPLSIQEVWWFMDSNGDPITERDGKPQDNPYIDLIERAKKRKKSEHDKAEKDNAIKDIGGRLPTLTDKAYQYTLTKNLFRRTENGREKAGATKNGGFVAALLQAVIIDNNKRGTAPRKTHSVDLMAISREMGKDINANYIKKKTVADSSEEDTQEPQKAIVSRTEAREYFVYDKIIADLDNVWGTLPFSTTEYKLISIESYNPETGILCFSTPLMDATVSVNSKKAAAQIESGGKPYLWYSDLLHATAGNDRNPAAFEMTQRIIQGVVQRGITPDAKTYKRKKMEVKDKSVITWEITCQSLINDCPLIHERLERLPNASRQTQALKKTFAAMYKMLKTKSDIYSKYLDFSITETIPTSRTLNTVITVKHYGINPDYKEPIPPIRK